MAEKELVRRGGVLCQPEQLEAGASGGSDQVGAELALEFCRALIRMTWSGDKIALAAYAAKDAVGATDEQMAGLVRAVYLEKARR